MGDDAYVAAGASIAADADAVFAAADMIVKVKEPQPAECSRLRKGQILFTYLHLAPDPEQTKALVASGAVCIAYETVTSPSGGLPLLAPMSEVAGRMSVQAGAHFLEKPHGGKGILLGGVPGVAPAKVVILGGGVVGTHAAMIALGMGANVTVLDRSLEALTVLWRQFGAALKTEFSSHDSVERHVTRADLVIGGVLIPGASAPKLVTAQMVQAMQPGSVVVDVAIDQGGCFETSHATTHAEPTYRGGRRRPLLRGQHARRRAAHVDLRAQQRDAALWPGASPTRAGKRRWPTDAHLRNGLNVALGKVTCAPVAEALGYAFVDPTAVIG